MPSYPVLSKQAKEHGKSKPPVAHLPRPEGKQEKVKHLIARYEVRI